jgi:hypothetical protein
MAEIFCILIFSKEWDVGHTEKFEEHLAIDD